MGGRADDGLELQEGTRSPPPPQPRVHSFLWHQLCHLSELSQNWQKTILFLSVLVSSPFSDFLQLVGSGKANTGTRKAAGARSWRQEAEVGSLLPAEASC